jgi:hypothetical protein
MVNTDMPPKGMKTELMIQPEVRAQGDQWSGCINSSSLLMSNVHNRVHILQDVAEAVMLAVRTKQSCTPSDITLRPTEPVQPLD